ncbi:MmgE/PrpD family protein [Alteromonas sp. C1M14]|uniref:MmgE/PrpD family protein n=1 Tax=Alteromonas sp. C1M14 TaxID=2841567 RepID=UPI001C0A4A3F|nr:MmgE/PrpD family protein [Alteromonas sp. C1M14]MBU2980025.1 MmgE/PrpD family protein [Alteromonas sp. C1M14]
MTKLNISDNLAELIHYTQALQYSALDETTINALKTFLLDSIGVGICGARVPFGDSLLNLCHAWGQGDDAQVLNRNVTLPASSAAMMNAWQIHNQEFDCVHEEAVVHPMAVILGSLLAYSQKNQKVSGRDFLSALCAGVDVATTLGAASKAPLTFFRPAWCGALGAVLAIAKLERCSETTTANALGIVYSMLGGTMQAHVEGTSMLAMQIGIAARSSIQAIDMANAGLDAPHNILEGPYGFFSLIERESDFSSALLALKQQPRINQVSHKPFPTGRACHGGLDALRTLMEQHQFGATDVAKATLSAPPLIGRLIGRRPQADMAVSYARLCFSYSAACLLLDGDVFVDCYDDIKRFDPARLALAARFSVESDGSEDPNAMTPQTLTVTLVDGTEYQHFLPSTLGSPARPLSQQQHLDKFRQCCLAAPHPLTYQQIHTLIGTVDDLECCDDIGALVRLSMGM